MTRMNGWAGKILEVDLLSRETKSIALDPEVARKFIGGRGLNTWLLYERGPRVDPQGSDNPLILGIGPLSGTPFGGGRITFTTRSATTGFIVDGNAGGFFAPAMAAAGYDALIFTGKAEKPVYVVIDDDQVCVRDASHLWGRLVSETEGALLGELGPGYQVRSIGPAGEHGVNSAVIIGNYHHSGGRAGAGAVMGMKNLKAVAIRGSGPVRIADPHGFLTAYRTIWKELSPLDAIDVFLRPWGSFGDSAVAGYIGLFGGLPTRNDQEGVFEDAELIGPEAIAQLTVKPKSCYGCAIPSCAHWAIQNQGPNAGRGFKIHAGTIMGLGSNLGCNNLSQIVDNHIYCNELGLDDFASYGIGWAFEAYEKGIITRADTDGLELKWGDAAAVREMLRKLAYREGIGDYLANGVRTAAARYGGEEFALEVKGVDYTGVSPRTFFSMAVAYAVNDHGATHTKIYPPYPPLPQAVPPDLPLPYDASKAAVRNIPEGKGALVKWLMDTRAVINSLESCVYWSRGKLYTDQRLHANLLSKATGVEFSVADLYASGERIVNLERCINALNGATRLDDRLPARFLKEPYTKGGSAGQLPPLDQMLEDYYRERGWDPVTARPTRAKLVDLGLAEVADALAIQGGDEE